MDCSKMLDLIQRLVDGGLEPREAARARGHLEACVSCRRLHQGLVRAGRAVAALPLRRPSRGFDAKVLAALGPLVRLAPQHALPTWLSAAALALAACGLSGIVWAVSSGTSLADLLEAAALLADPARAGALLKLRLLELSLAAYGLCRTASVWLPILAPQFGAGQLLSATVLSAVMLTAIAGGAPRSLPAPHRRTS